MADSSSHSADQRPIIRELVNVIESLRKKRRQRCSKDTHPESKRFTQKDLLQVCPSYTNLVLGRTGHLPPRDMVLLIAEFLECTIHERNDLLQAARYSPEQRELPEDQYQTSLFIAKSVLRELPYPAFVGTHGMIHKCNEYFVSLNGLSRSQRLYLNSSECPILATTFNPSVGTRDRLHPDRKMWQENARISVTIFQQSYAWYHQEEWYQKRVDEGGAWPGFKDLWDTTSTEVCPDPGKTFSAKIVYTALVPVGTERRLIKMYASSMTFPPFGPVDPFIFLLIPADNATRQTYRDLGIPVLENRSELQ